MTVHKRTEITVETERILIIRQRRSVKAMCPECGYEAEMVSLGEAEALTKASGQEFSESAPAHRWHLCRTEEGTWFVCLESLWK
jgi:hypothetical protein